MLLTALRLRSILVAVAPRLSSAEEGYGDALLALRRAPLVMRGFRESDDEDDANLLLLEEFTRRLPFAPLAG